MGTNYYTINRKTGERIHLGKASAGWVFLFRYQPDFYRCNRESVNRFLKLNAQPIVDEYGDEISLEDFWHMVENRKNHLNINSIGYSASTGVASITRMYIHSEDDLWFLDAEFS